MAQKTGGATETPIKPGDKPQDVADDLTAEDPTIEGLIEAEHKAVEALTEAAMTLHDIREDLLEQLEDHNEADRVYQPIRAAITGIEGSIRELDAAIRRQAEAASSHEETEALGMESSTGVTSYGRPVSRAITEQAAEAKGPSHIPGIDQGLTWPDAKTPEEIGEAGLTGLGGGKADKDK